MEGFFMFKVILGVLFFTIISLVVFVNLDPNLPQSLSTSSMAAGYASISLSGEVLKPGTYLIDEESDLQDALELAGGLTANADELAFNESLRLEVGMAIYIAPKFDPSDVCQQDPLSKIGLNTATAKEFTQLSNIGQSLADEIIRHRQEVGSFTYLEQIMNVSGIGNATFVRIRNYITLQ
jgi:competence protein ComEA